MSETYIAYDLKLTIELDSGPFVNGLTLLSSSTVSGPEASCDSTISKLSPTEVIISSLRLDCEADVHLEAIVSVFNRAFCISICLYICTIQ